MMRALPDDRVDRPCAFWGRIQRQPEYNEQTCPALWTKQPPRLRTIIQTPELSAPLGTHLQRKQVAILIKTMERKWTLDAAGFSRTDEEPIGRWKRQLQEIGAAARQKFAA